MNWKKVGIVVAIALAVMFVVSNPTGAAGLVTGVLGWLKAAAESVIQFLTSINF